MRSIMIEKLNLWKVFRQKYNLLEFMTLLLSDKFIYTHWILVIYKFTLYFYDFFINRTLRVYKKDTDI